MILRVYALFLFLFFPANRWNLYWVVNLYIYIGQGNLYSICRATHHIKWCSNHSLPTVDHFCFFIHHPVSLLQLIVAVYPLKAFCRLSSFKSTSTVLVSKASQLWTKGSASVPPLCSNRFFCLLILVKADRVIYSLMLLLSSRLCSIPTEVFVLEFSLWSHELRLLLFATCAPLSIWVKIWTASSLLLSSLFVQASMYIYDSARWGIR